MGCNCFAVLHTLTLLVVLSLTTFAAGSRPRLALAGEPFGVGRLEIELPQSATPEVLGVSGISVTEEHGRVFYPAVERRAGLPPVVKNVLSQARRPALRILGEVLSQPAGRTSVCFLFVGGDPLRITVETRWRQLVVVVPQADPARHARELAGWWRQYTSAPAFWENKADHPLLVENYLQSMLARRLNLPLPGRPHSTAWLDQFSDEVGLTLDSETLRIDYQRELFLGPENPREPANQPLPQEMPTPAVEMPEPPAGVAIEPIASRVPVECLYVRFGSFANFLWFQDTMALWQGDFQNLVQTRGLDYNSSGRMEKQLATQMTAMARLLGGVLVDDVAIVGADLYFREGGAYGLLFRVRNGSIFAADMTRQRQEWVQAGRATETKLKVNGHDVSYLSSRDGVTRSFYAADGDYHFITTSKTLVRRFLETGSGERSLGQSKEFRYARSLVPVSRNHTIFAYLSSAFFTNLIGPHYRIELMRRMQAEADIELAELALLAAAAEKRPSGSIAELSAAGLLPPGFGPLSDGSRTLWEEGRVVDSLRGQRGSSCPSRTSKSPRSAPPRQPRISISPTFLRRNGGGSIR